MVGFFFIIPLLYSALNGEISTENTFYAFLFSATISLGTGLTLTRIFPEKPLNSVQAILVCSLGWIVISAVGAIPFVLGIGANYLDAYFETMSGFTTTGITMFTGLDSMPRSILLWRSIIQWVGGLGILTFFLFVTSQISGIHTLFGAESHKINSKRLVPGMMNTIKILWGIYILFTLTIIIALKIAGTSLFDSICHSFTALSTGGFSPYDASIAHYQIIGHANYIWIEYIIILGMLLGGTGFLIHYRILRRDFRALYDNTEMRLWVGFITFFTLIIFLEIYLKSKGVFLNSDSGSFWKNIEENFRATLFQVIAIITTTGFGTKDIGSPFFGYLASQLFLVMMVIGGCVGSTAGGIKMLRIGILFKLIKREIHKVVSPRKSINYVLVDKNRINPDEIYRVTALFFAWIALLVFGGIVTALFSDLDGLSSFSGMCSAVGNIGPCYISVEQMTQLNPIIKIVYIFGMLAGRLEILPVFLLFSPRAWKY